MHQPLVHRDALSSVNVVLDKFFAQSIADAAAIDPSYERLWKSLFALVSSGGKRLRPQMTLLAYEAFGGTDQASILPVAAAQELLHISLLIHDDIIDRDYTRYGVANVAGQYKLAYAQFMLEKDDVTHFAHSAAVLAGDLMISAAHQMIAASSLSGTDIALAQHLMSQGIFEVAGGELLDTELSFMPYKSGDALKVAAHKTASYSFVTPLLTGARLAGASEERCKALRAYAQAVGIAYQLTDDLLGVYGDEKTTGKSTVSDLIEGKRTYMIEKALDVFTLDEQTAFMRAFGNAHATSLELEMAKRLLESSGARQKTVDKINEYANAAMGSLAELDLQPELHQKFSLMVRKVSNRTS